MSKELIIVVGIPYSGRSTWLSKKYSEEGTVIIEESKFEKLYKDGKVQESEFISSNEWVNSQVKEQMEASTQRIVVSVFQSRPDHWVEMLEFAKVHGYSFTPVKPNFGCLFYDNKFGRLQEQIEWVQKSTQNRFPKVVKDKKKKADEEEKEKENPNLYHNIVVEFQSSYAFILQNRELGTDVNKWLETINKQYKPVIIRGKQAKEARDARIAKEAEKAAREAAKKAEKEAKEAAKKAEEESKAQLANNELNLDSDSDSDSEPETKRVVVEQESSVSNVSSA